MGFIDALCWRQNSTQLPQLPNLVVCSANICSACLFDRFALLGYSCSDDGNRSRQCKCPYVCCFMVKWRKKLFFGCKLEQTSKRRKTLWRWFIGFCRSGRAQYRQVRINEGKGSNYFCTNLLLFRFFSSVITPLYRREWRPEPSRSHPVTTVVGCFLSPLSLSFHRYYSGRHSSVTTLQAISQSQRSARSSCSVTRLYRNDGNTFDPVTIFLFPLLVKVAACALKTVINVNQVFCCLLQGATSFPYVFLLYIFARIIQTVG